MAEKTELDLETQQFVLAIRYRALADNSYHGASRKSMTKLVIEIQERIVNPKNRKDVLRAITALPISSQKELTQHYVSVLIDEITDNERSKHILEQIERLIETQPSVSAWKLFPQEWLEASLSAVSDGNTTAT